MAAGSSELDINKILTADNPVGVLSSVLDLLPRFNDAKPARGNEVIVLMDEIQKFFLDNNGQKIANALKGPLRDGKIAVIATTTRKDYKEFIEKDDAFRRRFEKIDIVESTVEETIIILRARKAWLLKLHDAFIPDEALVAAAKLTDQFDKTNFNPDKAIKAVQDGAEFARPDNLRSALTLDVREIWSRLVVAFNEARQALMDKAVASTLALPIESYNHIAGLIKKAEALYAERESIRDGESRVTIDVVKRVIAQKTGIASGQLDMGADDPSRYNDMEKTVGERVVNQAPALTAIANAIRRNKAGLSNPHRPMGKFLLTGPTGVGKTYLAKELARFPLQRPRGHDPHGHVRVHGGAQRPAPDRRASRLCRLRRGRPADRGGAQEALLRHPLRRDREGPSEGLRRSASDPGRRPPDRRRGPHHRLQEYRHHHDLQRRHGHGRRREVRDHDRGR